MLGSLLGGYGGLWGIVGSTGVSQYDKVLPGSIIVSLGVVCEST